MRKRDEPVRLTRIYTRTGDAGETSLGDGSRIAKTDPRVEAIGDVDELNSALGWALAAGRNAVLERVQNELFDLGADLSVPFVEGDGRLRVDAGVDRPPRSRVRRGEREARAAEELRPARRHRDRRAALPRTRGLPPRRAPRARGRRGESRSCRSTSTGSPICFSSSPARPTAAPRCCGGPALADLTRPTGVARLA